MNKEEIINTINDVKAFYSGNKELFDGFAAAVKILLDAVKDTEATDIAETFEWQMELIQAEKLLDEDIAQRKKGAALMQKLISLLLDAFGKTL